MASPAGMGVTLLRITIVMLVLSWSTVVARLSVRRWLKPEAMGMDDHMMCVGLVSAFNTCSRTLFDSTIARREKRRREKGPGPLAPSAGWQNHWTLINGVIFFWFFFASLTIYLYRSFIPSHVHWLSLAPSMVRDNIQNTSQHLRLKMGQR